MSQGAATEPPSSGGVTPSQRLRLQRRPLQLGQRPEIAEVEQPVDHVEVGGRQVAARGAAASAAAAASGSRPRAGQPRATAAGPQQRLERDEQVVGLVDLDLDVGVARDAEGVVLDDRHPREQPVEVGGDHLLERHEPASAGELEEPGQERRDLDPREAAHAGLSGRGRRRRG